MQIAILGALVLTAWVAVALLGTQAYFRGEQTKPIHERNWRSPGFHRLAETFSGQQVDYQNRASSYKVEQALDRVLS